MFWSQILYSRLTHQTWTYVYDAHKKASQYLVHSSSVSGYYREMWHTAVRVDPEHLKHAMQELGGEEHADEVTLEDFRQYVPYSLVL